MAGVSSDTWLENRRFAAAEGVEFPLLSDWPLGQTITAFGLSATDGRARRATIVFDGEAVVRRVIVDVEPTAHGALALAALRTFAEADPRT